MTKVRVAGFSISLDGFGAGPEQSLENPLRILIHGDDDDMHPRHLLLDLGGAFHTRGIRQLDVHQHHVRLRLRNFLQRLRHPRPAGIIEKNIRLHPHPPHRPAQRTKRPSVSGVQSAKVVGDDGGGDDDAIHVDEEGRVRVKFAWDRDSTSGDASSSWLRVSEGWAGAAFGIVALPRVGQEVLVAFLDGVSLTAVPERSRRVMRACKGSKA